MSSEYFLAEVPDVLSAEEIANIIDLARSHGFEAATVRAGGKSVDSPMVRNNQRAEWTDQELARTIWNRVTTAVPTPGDGAVAVGLNPLWRVYRYERGERFNAHRDGVVEFDERTASRLTLLVSLQNAAVGGGTIFFHDRAQGTRRGARYRTLHTSPGSAVLFDHRWWHSGERVEQGSKLILRSDVFFQHRP